VPGDASVRWTNDTIAEARHSSVTAVQKKPRIQNGEAE
jgi:hypothetical protein